MKQTIENPDKVITKRAGDKGRVYLGTEFEDRQVQIAVSAVDDDPVGWDDVLELIDDAEPGAIPEDVLDSMLAVLTVADESEDDPTDSEWSEFATALTSTPADDLPDHVVSAMNAKMTQLDMEARDE